MTLELRHERPRKHAFYLSGIDCTDAFARAGEWVSESAEVALDRCRVAAFLREMRRKVPLKYFDFLSQKIQSIG